MPMNRGFLNVCWVEKAENCVELCLWIVTALENALENDWKMIGFLGFLGSTGFFWVFKKPLGFFGFDWVSGHLWSPVVTWKHIEMTFAGDWRGRQTSPTDVWQIAD